MARKLFVLIAALALVAAACGGGDDAADTPATTAATTQAPSQDATTTTAAPSTTATTTAAPTTTTAAPTMPMASTFRELVSDDSFEATSARYEAVLSFASDGTDDLPPMAEMRFSGAFNKNTNSSQIMVEFGSLFGALEDEVPPGFEDFFSEPMEVIQIDTTSYVKWGLFSFFTGPDVEWVEFTGEDAEGLVSDFSFGFDPTQSPFDNFDQLGEAGVTVEEVGSETIRGVDTTQYHAIVDAETLAEELPEDEAQELRETFGAGGLDDLEFDLFIGDDGLLYRYVLTLDASAIPESEGLTGLSVVFDIYDYNTDIVIEAPPAELVTSGDELGGLFSGFLGGG